MDIIYSASALGAFSSSLIYIGFFFFLGLGGLLLNYLPKRKRKEKFLKRHSLGCLSILILFFGVTTAIATYNTFTGGDKTVQVQVLEKEEVTRKCNKSYCTYYEVETTDGEKLYRFGLEKDTWDKMEVDAVISSPITLSSLYWQIIYRKIVKTRVCMNRRDIFPG